MLPVLEVEVVSGGRMIESPLDGRVGFDVYAATEVILRPLRNDFLSLFSIILYIYIYLVLRVH